MSGARNSDPRTSHAAFASLKSLPHLEIEVLEVIRRFGDKGCIADQIVAELPHLRAHTVIPRFAPLLEKGLIEDTGEVRIGGAGRMQRVVRAVPPERVSASSLNYLLNLKAEGKIELGIYVRNELPKWVKELLEKENVQTNVSHRC